jgi:hypothetical protein
MTWNEELNGQLDVVHARLTRIEILSMLMYERDASGPTRHPLSAVPSTSNMVYEVVVPAYASALIE